MRPGPALQSTRARSGFRWLALCAGLILLVALDAAAEVYRSVAPDGTVTYSDNPPPGHSSVERIELPEASDLQPALVDDRAYVDSWTGPVDSEESEAVVPNVEVTILTPANDQALRSDDGSLTVEIAVAPELRSGDVVEILLDGYPVARSQSLVALLTAVDRGTHVLVARVLDSSGLEVAVSPAVNVHLLRHSRAHPRPANPAQNLPPPTS